MLKTAQYKNQGFTLVELLVVIAIIAILAAVVVLIINPLELTRRGRDATRLADLANLQNVITVAVQEITGTNIACPAAQTNNTVCTDTSGAGSRAVDGTGWVKINLSAQKSVTIPTLPVDPINTGTYVYTYGGRDNVSATANEHDWEINAVLESAKYTTAPDDKRLNDGGNAPTIYEVGSSLILL